MMLRLCRFESSFPRSFVVSPDVNNQICGEDTARTSQLIMKLQIRKNLLLPRRFGRVFTVRNEVADLPYEPVDSKAERGLMSIKSPDVAKQSKEFAVPQIGADNGSGDDQGGNGNGGRGGDGDDYGGLGGRGSLMTMAWWCLRRWEWLHGKKGSARPVGDVNFMAHRAVQILSYLIMNSTAGPGIMASFALDSLLYLFVVLPSEFSECMYSFHRDLVMLLGGMFALATTFLGTTIWGVYRLWHHNFNCDESDP